MVLSEFRATEGMGGARRADHTFNSAPPAILAGAWWAQPAHASPLTGLPPRVPRARHRRGSSANEKASIFVGNLPKVTVAECPLDSVPASASKFACYMWEGYRRASLRMRADELERR